jgi:hypothetical protein
VRALNFTYKEIVFPRERARVCWLLYDIVFRHCKLRDARKRVFYWENRSWFFRCQEYFSEKPVCNIQDQLT